MSIYPPKITELSNSLKFTGSIKNSNASGMSASFSCGCFARFDVFVSEADNIISDIKYRSNGCGYMLAGAEAVAESVIGRSVAELEGFGEKYMDRLIVDRDISVPEERKQCFNVVVEALGEAFADHRRRLIDEFIGEKALICTCFGITEEEIGAFIATASPISVDDVSKGIRAGGGCGSCRMLIQEMLDGAEDPHDV